MCIYLRIHCINLGIPFILYGCVKVVIQSNSEILFRIRLNLKYLKETRFGFWNTFKKPLRYRYLTSHLAFRGPIMLCLYGGVHSVETCCYHHDDFIIILKTIFYRCLYSSQKKKILLVPSVYPVRPLDIPSPNGSMSFLRIHCLEQHW